MLNEVANKLYDFIIANWRSNEQFNDMVNETEESIKSTIVNIDTEKVLINLVFQTYAYIGSRSIYLSGIINRDVAKLKFISGMKVTEEDYRVSGNDFLFSSWDPGANRLETVIVDSILRICAPATSCILDFGIPH
ncbi:hypothetical protein JCM33374_g6672 [Metschnikowia sp. JCM 33374]|nr:hypothetical protein JCM33374_g6672 [Metschnikowia sp. JCM 33374]